ncbi:hypothetical protein [Phenylobacterium sp.]|jgi:hypothetical protein|uniref:hypothetical protein n=1 Tax=Phenylobacterium sp. TaxID=1871053 RepID=UPI0035668252
MAAASAPTRLSDQFNAFLRSALWLDRDETPLSVLSALARLDVDPWEEAAQLAALPEPSASARLAAMLANLPGGPSIRRDLDAICVRSISLLSCPAGPERSNGAAPSNLGVRSGAFLFLVLGTWMVALTLMAAQGPAGGARPAGPAAHASGLPAIASRAP